MLKTNKSVAKRIKTTARGKLKRTRAFKGHILTKKTRKRKRHLRRSALVSTVEARRIRRMLPYG
ncbi:50S ribosomal protein L35 [Candidatus Velamenicoccus archaeovorus]|uniref:Large ribosomal subunit protein bL35 n=1 Tax=Velamenicoccus archaeovorus TaxID=1930593 RepID=A0A410P6V7_VELA1|nr:50S ribosomal protein L35 [Candidatus Velamenicoccus archaeovorus]QAT17936.1 50S ribosomal protein L35 [Candidatus Velamenicoccus archaeovorus]